MRRESFLCMSGENGSLLYASQREFGPGCGLVSSTRRGAFLSGLPRGGAPAAASHTGQEERLGGGARRCWDGKMLGGSRKRTCAGFMKSSGRTERKYLSLCFSPCVLQRWRTPLCNIGVKSEASVAQEDKSYDWSESAGSGNYQHKQHKVYRWIQAAN